MPGGLPAVDVQDLAGDERGALEVEDPVDHVADLAEPAEWVKAGHALVGGGVVRRGPDDPERDRVDAHAARRVLDRQRAGDGGESALGQRRERRRRLAARRGRRGWW